jgi:uncharacterized protein
MSTPGEHEQPAAGVRSRLGLALRTALRARDQAATAAFRSALAAIANAEAVDVVHDTPARASSAHIAGAAAGPGATEAARRELSPDAVAGIVRAEIADRQVAAGQYAAAGHGERAARLEAEARALQAVLGLPAAG